MTAKPIVDGLAMLPRLVDAAITQFPGTWTACTAPNSTRSTARRPIPGGSARLPWRLRGFRPAASPGTACACDPAKA